MLENLLVKVVLCIYFALEFRWSIKTEGSDGKMLLLRSGGHFKTCYFLTSRMCELKNSGTRDQHQGRAAQIDSSDAVWGRSLVAIQQKVGEVGIMRGREEREKEEREIGGQHEVLLSGSMLTLKTGRLL